ncbi:hypothetical protein RM545_06500 [Zunongwangia sp. F260]|uniref:Uncharacterized protein n=1 Tax=Autumnicola lenta TaxID=3075593 RepID=A0ABU3CJ16_9FLAO|nr:hypothetical protein [Zunongwangia sp. F260]MDT0646335.1 hypothetical protein [Zunongwangia sp. F260]
MKVEPLQPKYISGWKNLCNYLGGAKLQSTIQWVEDMNITKYKKGKNVVFKIEDIDNALIPVERKEKE